MCAEAERLGFLKLVSRIFPENVASLAVHRKVGFREVGTYRRHGKLDGKWLLALQNTTQQPAQVSLEERAVRERLFKASTERAEHGDANDTRPLVKRRAELRVESGIDDKARVVEVDAGAPRCYGRSRGQHLHQALGARP